MININFKIIFPRLNYRKTFASFFLPLLCASISTAISNDYSILKPEAEEIQKLIQDLEKIQKAPDLDVYERYLEELQHSDEAFGIQCQFLNVVRTVQAKKDRITPEQSKKIQKRFRRLAGEYYHALKEVLATWQHPPLRRAENFEMPVQDAARVLAYVGLPREKASAVVKDKIHFLHNEHKLTPDIILYFLAEKTFTLQDSTSEKITLKHFTDYYQVLIKEVLRLGYDPFPAKSYEYGFFQVLRDTSNPSKISNIFRQSEFLQGLCKLYRGPHFDKLIKAIQEANFCVPGSTEAWVKSWAYAGSLNNLACPMDLADKVIGMPDISNLHDGPEAYYSLTKALARKCSDENFSKILERLSKLKGNEHEERYKTGVYTSLLGNSELSDQNQGQVQSLVDQLSLVNLARLTRELENRPKFSLVFGSSFVVVDSFCILRPTFSGIENMQKLYIGRKSIPIVDVKNYPELQLSLMCLEEPISEVLPTNRYYGSPVDSGLLCFNVPVLREEGPFAYMDDPEDHKLLYGYESNQLTQPFRDWLNSKIILSALEE